MPRLQHLRAALEALEDGGSPHIVSEQSALLLAQGTRLNLASGAWIEIGKGPVPPALTDVAAALFDRWGSDFVHDSYDDYRFTAPGAAAVEIRAMAGISVLWVALRDSGQTWNAVCVQDDPARWRAEEAGLLGPSFADHAERNATWAGLGRPRPRGWTLNVVQAGPTS